MLNDWERNDFKIILKNRKNVAIKKMENDEVKKRPRLYIFRTGENLNLLFPLVEHILRH